MAVSVKRAPLVTPRTFIADLGGGFTNHDTNPHIETSTITHSGIYISNE